MKTIYLLQTGGTIVMEPNAEGGDVSSSFLLDSILQEVPEIARIADIRIENLFFEDSSNLNSGHWHQIIKALERLYDQADGFVILHGTDTVAYTASALSFALCGLDKPVIFTGSQVPLRKIRSDARRNLINSIEIATMAIPEVAICFNDHLYRANRTTKISIGDFDAFESPNFPYLANIGVTIETHGAMLQPQGRPEFFAGFSEKVHLIKLYPGFNPDHLSLGSNPDIEAIVIEAFGTGNFPSKGAGSILPFLKQCREHNKIVAVTSQAMYDSVMLSTYEGGRKALELGVLEAGDMTTEACLTKLMYLLGRYPGDAAAVSASFGKPLCGELTE